VAAVAFAHADGFPERLADAFAEGLGDGCTKSICAKGAGSQSS